MHYYQFHIGDFRSGSVQLTRLERWLYRDMLDVYYDSETPLTLDLAELCDALGVRTNEERNAVEHILRVKFTKAHDGYHSARCDDSITAYHGKRVINATNGSKGGRKRREPKANPVANESLADGLPGLSEGQAKPINHKPVLKDLAENSAVPAGFAEFWKAYPRKVKKPQSVKAWKAQRITDADIARVVSAVERFKQSREWKQDGGQFIPHPSSWLNARQWEDVAQSPLQDTRPDWCVQAGFANIYEANNARCFEHNAHTFTDGQKVVAA